MKARLHKAAGPLIVGVTLLLLFLSTLPPPRWAGAVTYDYTLTGPIGGVKIPPGSGDIIIGFAKTYKVGMISVKATTGNINVRPDGADVGWWVDAGDVTTIPDASRLNARIDYITLDRSAADAGIQVLTN